MKKLINVYYNILSKEYKINYKLMMKIEKRLEENKK
jgi:hypothetical protein